MVAFCSDRKIAEYFLPVDICQSDDERSCGFIENPHRDPCDSLVYGKDEFRPEDTGMIGLMIEQVLQRLLRLFAWRDG